MTMEVSKKSLSKDLEGAKGKLTDVQKQGNDAISKWDLSMGYDAAFYLKKNGILHSHVSFHQRQLDNFLNNNAEGGYQFKLEI